MGIELFLSDPILLTHSKIHPFLLRYLQHSSSTISFISKSNEEEVRS